LNYGCLVIDVESSEVLHYVEKPTTFVSTLINCGVYLFTSNIFVHLANVFKEKTLNDSNGDFIDAPESIWFENDVFPKMVASNAFFALRTTRWWSQLKSASAAIYANRHCLNLYRETHPDRLTKTGEPKGLTIIGDVYIHPTAKVHSSATIGPNVSIGRNVVVGAGVRIKESIVLEGATLQDHCCILHSVIGWNSTVGIWSRVEGTPSGPNPNMPFAKLESKPLFNTDGRLNPSITILGCNVQVPGEVIIMNSIVLPHKELRGSYKNQIIL